MKEAWCVWRDPLFWGATAGYVAFRLLRATGLTPALLRHHGTDLLLIPVALPLALELQHGLGWRRRGDAPTWQETLLHFVVWSVLCEGVGPLVLHRGTADAWDVLCYAGGAIPALLWWSRWGVSLRGRETRSREVV